LVRPLEYTQKGDACEGYQSSLTPGDNNNISTGNINSECEGYQSSLTPGDNNNISTGNINSECEGHPATVKWGKECDSM